MDPEDYQGSCQRSNIDADANALLPVIEILLKEIKIISCKAYAFKGPRIPIRSPGYVINFQLEILCNGLM